MADTLTVENRESMGTRAAQRIRDNGRIPAVLYGHGEATKHLTIQADQLAAVMRHGGKLVELKGAVNESAFLKELQWGPLGMVVLHVDMTRVSAHEKVEVTVPVELRGEAPGAKEGGIVEHVVHEVEILCPARSLPEKLSLKINGLHLDDALHASDLSLPEGASLITAAETLIVHCVLPAAEEEAVPGEAAEPELIGRKAEDEEGDEG